MICPYTEPTIEQCLNCKFPECHPRFPEPDQKAKQRERSHSWYIKHRKEVIEKSTAYQHKKAALRRQSKSGTKKNSASSL